MLAAIHSLKPQLHLVPRTHTHTPGLLYESCHAQAFVDELCRCILALADTHTDQTSTEANMCEGGAVVDQQQREMEARVQAMLLETLACDSVTVRVCAYTRLQAILTEEHAAREGGIGRQTGMLLESEVIYQIVLHRVSVRESHD